MPSDSVLEMLRRRAAGGTAYAPTQLTPELQAAMSARPSSMTISPILQQALAARRTAPTQLTPQLAQAMAQRPQGQIYPQGQMAQVRAPQIPLTPQTGRALAAAPQNMSAWGPSGMTQEQQIADMAQGMLREEAAKQGRAIPLGYKQNPSGTFSPINPWTPDNAASRYAVTQKLGQPANFTYLYQQVQATVPSAPESLKQAVVTLAMSILDSGMTTNPSEALDIASERMSGNATQGQNIWESYRQTAAPQNAGLMPSGNPYTNIQDLVRETNPGLHPRPRNAVSLTQWRKGR